MLPRLSVLKASHVFLSRRLIQRNAKIYHSCRPFSCRDKSSLSWSSLSVTSPVSSSGATSLSENFVKLLRNGMLEKDDYYRNGIPSSPYQLAFLDSAYHRCYYQSNCKGNGVDNRMGLLTLEEIFSYNKVDPFGQVSQYIAQINGNIKKLVCSDHPILNHLATYYFDQSGKNLRPTIALLIANASSYGLSSTYAIPTNTHLDTRSNVHSSPAPAIDQNNSTGLGPMRRDIATG